MTFEEFTPFVISDSRYSLHQWPLIPYCDAYGQLGQQLMLECLYNEQLSKGCNVVENVFGILKQSFCELLDVTDLNVNSFLMLSSLVVYFTTSF